MKTSSFLLRHGTLWAYRFATWAVIVFGLAFAAGVIALRYWLLPNADAWREPVAGAISRAVGQTVHIGGIEGSWDGFRPNLKLRDVRVADREGAPSLTLAQADTVLSWVALLRGDLRFHSLEISAPAVEARRDVEGRVWIAGQALAADRGADEGRGGFVRWLLAQRQVVVRDARVVWNDEFRGAPELVLEDAALRVDSVAGRHRFGIIGRLPAELASEFSVRGELTGGAAGVGTVYGELGYANIALLQQWVDLPVVLESATGSSRFWLDLAHGRLARATVDANVVNLRGQSADGTPRFAFSRLAGRLVWQSSEDAMQLAAYRLTFTTADGVYLPPVDIRWRQEAGDDGHGEVAVAGIPLAPVAELAHHLPLADALRDRLRGMQPEGTVRSGRIAWSGGTHAPRTYAVELEFQQVAFRPTQSLPGIRGVDGRLQASESGGTLSLASMSGAFEFPRVFAEPIPFDYLNADAGWHVQDGVTRVDVRNLSFTNPHAAGNFFGTYTRAGSGPGSVDLNGNLVRADARQVWRYLPVNLPHTRNWLRRALKSGQAVNATLRLHGPLERFPFPGGRGGEFEVRAQLDGITLEYADGWPAIESVSGELVFAGERMQFSASAGRILGVDVSRTRAEIPGLGGRHRERLTVRGEAEGPLEGFVRFIGESPVKFYLGRFSEGLQASGRGALRLALDLPLDRAVDALVDGEMQIDANEFRLGRLPPFTAATANVAFSHKGIRIREGRAQFLGGPLRFGTTGGEGEAMTVALSGRIDMARARDGLSAPALAALEGTTDWRGTLTVQRNATRLLLDSDLIGVASRLPAPLDKIADSRLPLRIDLRDQTGGRELLSLDLGTRAAAQVLLREGVVERGTVSFGAPAPLPTGPGIRLAGTLDVLDVAAWGTALRRETGSTGPLPAVSALDLRIGLLDVRGRQVRDLGVVGTHDGQVWRVELDGREVKGALSWANDRDGRLEARFEKLQIPAPVSRVAVGPPPEFASARERLPAIDLVADRFVFEGMDLGRLEMLADPAPASWTLRRLQISNPDGRLELNGRWTMATQPKTDLDVTFEAIDAGKLLVRLGYPDGLRGGRGTLAGPVSWVGSPARLDVPTLSGRLRLDVRDGRFAQLEPGVGRLLGVLSLQALPRRFAFDFRDVFSSGFSFEKITANVTIDRGVASTEDLRMEGPPARVFMAGTVNLAEERQDLRVRVLPQLSTGVAIAGAMVNPAVGLAALIAQRVLGDPVEQIAAVEYKVTGTWTEPHLERIERSQNGGGRN